MSLISLFRGLEGLENTAIENAQMSDGALVISVRPLAKQRSRCGRCLRRCPGYDSGAGRRRWRTLDHGTTMTYLEADTNRVQCPDHGVIASHVPWAAHDAGHTHTFDQHVSWLAVRMSKSAVSELMRTTWRTVGNIVSRVWNRTRTAHQAAGGGDGLDGLRRIGIDEVSYRRGQLFLTVVVDHDTARLVWAQPGRNRGTLREFFNDLGPDRSTQITHVSADQANWIRTVVTERAPQAIQCADPFHIVQWANKALTSVRATVWRHARAAGNTRKNGIERGRQRHDSTGEARELAHAKFTLLKNPENLTDKQHARLAWIAATHPDLWEAYRLKEGLRLALKLRGQAGLDALQTWLDQAHASNVPAFAHLAGRIEETRPRIENTIIHGLSNGLVESTNTKIRLLTRIAYGFHSPQPLIALAMLSLSHHRPQLPDRPHK